MYNYGFFTIQLRRLKSTSTDQAFGDRVLFGKSGSLAGSMAINDEDPKLGRLAVVIQEVQ
ncbi:hypothetical protein SUGI_1117490 [Cryptomeria japonica]|nr:hypothetical protein SUGI_1117490 [Cryptomeria japonica]